MTSLRAQATVADLPSVTFGQRSLMWWGTLGFMVIEGWTIALLLVSYLCGARSASWSSRDGPSRCCS